MTRTIEPAVEPTVESHFETNLRALSDFDPRLDKILRLATPPESARLTAGRDGQPTYSWTDDSLQRRWLGRTSMPTVSAPPLIDAFNPGHGNIVLHGFGSGLEVRLLLNRTGRHQAIFVVGGNAWEAALALRLRDFTEDIRRGRLRIFSGPDAWDDLRRFLIENDGYLTPERILAWPWFEPSDTTELTARLHEVGSAVAVARSKKDDMPQSAETTTDRTDEAVSIAVVSNLTDPGVRDLADRIVIGAESLGWACRRFTLDSPVMVRPQSIHANLLSRSPSLLLVLGVGPKSLPYRLPDVPGCVICSHEHGVSANWLNAIPDTFKIALPNARQVRQAAEIGVDPSRIVYTPAAAAFGGANERTDDPANERPGVLIIGDLTDASAESVGLNLESHRRLWNTARDVLHDRIEAYVDDHADEVLDEAQRRLGIKLDSQEVRQGLAERIRRILGPSIVYRAYVRALVLADVDISLYGQGWNLDETFANHHKGPRPNPAEAPRLFSRHAIIVSLPTSGRVDVSLLDGIAASLVGCVRVHPSDETDEGLAAVLEADAHVWRFGPPSGLVDIVKRFRASPGEFRDRARAATHHVNDRHTWRHRLRAIHQACSGVRSGR